MLISAAADNDEMSEFGWDNWEILSPVIVLLLLLLLLFIMERGAKSLGWIGDEDVGETMLWSMASNLQWKFEQM